jgi:tetratricopeptide (TPR) repeat protein
MEERELVAFYLRGQNLEQVGRTEEAEELYERAVTAGFDSVGPYDRLIAIYSNQARHADVIRVAEAALTHVRTYPDKRAWFSTMKEAALAAQNKVPRASPRTPPTEDRPDA